MGRQMILEGTFRDRVDMGENVKEPRPAAVEVHAVMVWFGRVY